MAAADQMPRVCHFSEFDSVLKGGGIYTSIQNQRKALKQMGVPYTTDPSDPFDILHLNVMGPFSIKQLLLARRNNIPIVMHAHTLAEEFKDNWRFSRVITPLADRYTLFFYHRADVLLPVSPYTKDSLDQKGVDTPKHVITNGVDPDRVASVRHPDAIADAYGLRNDTTVVTVGEVQPRKGLGTFLELAKRFPSVDFVWFGGIPEGLLSRKTMKQIKNAPENVTFTGYVEDVADAFTVADIYLQLSHKENQCIALLEAAYSGLPIIVRDLPVYQGWLVDGTHCRKADTVTAFADHLAEIADDGTLAEHLGEAAHTLAEKHTLDTVGEELLSVYTDVVAADR